ncbi:MAG: dienelactone hydrolase [Akkermansiaceae bacterium]|nr:dienelactone hydrolase [Akkermansiaceae bacterium]
MRILKVAALLAILTPAVHGGKDVSYDPLVVPDGAKAAVHDLEVRDAGRDREIPVRVYLPAGKGSHPVVLFSHGLGGSRENNAYVARHWAQRGYAVVAMQHAGSDEHVWRGVPAAQRRDAMKRAASGESFTARAGDVKAVLDQLTRWNGDGGHLLHGRLDLEKVGMSGHSFGAVTTQAVSGQSFGKFGPRFTDERIDAALAFSPSPPGRGDPQAAFGKVSTPWMLMTGTRDTSLVVQRTTPEKRRHVYTHLPDGDKYELVLHNAEHMAFSDRTLRGGEHRNPNHHKVIRALSTAFWDAHLRGDPAAKGWLRGDGPRGLMEEKDLWRLK